MSSPRHDYVCDKLDGSCEMTLPIGRDFFVVHVQPQPGGIVLIDDGEIVIVVFLGIDQEDAVRALQTYICAIRAVGRVLP